MKTIKVDLVSPKSPNGSCPSCGKQIIAEKFFKTATDKKVIGPCPHCGKKLRYYTITPHIFVRVKGRKS